MIYFFTSSVTYREVNFSGHLVLCCMDAAQGVCQPESVSCGELYKMERKANFFFVGDEERRRNIFLLYLANSTLRKLAACTLLGQQLIMSGTLKVFPLRIFWIFYIALNLKCRCAEITVWDELEHGTRWISDFVPIVQLRKYLTVLQKCKCLERKR